ncbi:MAG TPA: recombinase family protein [Candidatus Margulisiibacteriota bacterium]|nr:recombinase family protein [Candidatus Margulisiibacteriota bacterium]
MSRIPIGWVKRPDGSYDFDPEVKTAIDEVVQIFREKETVLATVRELVRRGRELPSRPRPRGPIKRDPPSALPVRRFLTHPWYAGTLVYGRTEEIPALGDQKARRVRLPEDRWIKVLNHHPAYYTVAEQEEFKKVLKAHRYQARRHPRNGAALCQGLLKCARCGVSLSVNYPRKATFRYLCQRNQTTFGRRRCVNFPGQAVDNAVERLFLAVLKAPPVELLQQALAEARAAEQVYTARIEADGKRLRYTEQLARDRYRECDPRNRLVAAELEIEFEQAKQAVIDFECRRASEPPRPPIDGTEEEVRELCELVADIPKLFRDAAVTQKERKLLLQCLIGKIIIEVDAEGIDGTIHWRSGETSKFRVWRTPGVHRLIHQRHDEGLTVPEIVVWLAEGDPQTGQDVAAHESVQSTNSSRSGA